MFRLVGHHLGDLGIVSPDLEQFEALADAVDHQAVAQLARQAVHMVDEPGDVDDVDLLAQAHRQHVQQQRGLLVAEFLELQIENGHGPAEERAIERADGEMLEKQGGQSLHRRVALDGPGTGVERQQQAEPDKHQGHAKAETHQHIRIGRISFLPSASLDRAERPHRATAGGGARRLEFAVGIRRHVAGDLHPHPAAGTMDHLTSQLRPGFELHVAAGALKDH